VPPMTVTAAAICETSTTVPRSMATDSWATLVQHRRAGCRCRQRQAEDGDDG
jgi:hypothetical protein